jgi:hypothetical protein
MLALYSARQQATTAVVDTASTNVGHTDAPPLVTSTATSTTTTAATTDVTAILDGQLYVSGRRGVQQLCQHWAEPHQPQQHHTHCTVDDLGGVLNCSAGNAAARIDGMRYLHLPLDDDVHQQLRPHLPTALAFIRTYMMSSQQLAHSTLHAELYRLLHHDTI